MRDHRDPLLGAPFDDAPAQRTVVERAQRNLDSRDRRQLERLVELTAVDVREADTADDAVVEEPRKRAHRRVQRRAWIGRVQEVEIDRQPVERGKTRLASARIAFALPSGTQAPPALVIPPSSRSVRARGRRTRERSSETRSLSPYARAVSKTVIPASAAAAIVAYTSSSARGSPVDRRMQPRPMRSSESSSQRRAPRSTAYDSRRRPSNKGLYNSLRPPDR